jgi:two-component system sensor histidine kinase CiaH
MHDPGRRRLYRTTTIYWLLLCYVIAALVWWFISLNEQNKKMRDLEIANTRYHLDSVQSPDPFHQQMEKAERTYKLNRSKYLGEGSIFLLLTLVSAAYVYRAVRRQFTLQQQQQNFMMAVTHELKTPISVTRLNLETLQRYNLDPEKQKKLLRTMLDETTRLNFLTNNILISSQLEARGYKSSKEELDLSDLTKDCLQDFRNRFTDRVFEENIEGDAAIKGDPLLLQILINNLLENALKYSPREAPVKATVHKERSRIVLSISDEGPGVPVIERKKIFNKFYRIGNEATRKKQGTGLGLYLCRKIANEHNADISVTNNEPTGSTFTVIFHS